MAKKESKGWDKQVIVGEFQKSASTIVRVSYVEAEPLEDGGEKFKAVDIREMYKKKGDTEWNYSAKGMTVPVDKLSDLKRLLVEAGIEVTKADQAETEKATKKPRTRKKAGTK